MKSHFQSYEMLTLSLPVNIAIMLMSSYLFIDGLMGHVQFPMGRCKHYELLHQHFLSFEIALPQHFISLEIGQCLLPPTLLSENAGLSKA